MNIILSSGSSVSRRRCRRVRPHTRNMHVDSAADRLEEKYEELRNLLTNNQRGVSIRSRYDDGLSAQARELIMQHEVGLLDNLF